MRPSRLEGSRVERGSSNLYTGSACSLVSVLKLAEERERGDERRKTRARGFPFLAAKHGKLSL